jgi:regulatory protein
MENQITALKVQKHNKERVNVFLDGEYAFAVNLMVAARLKPGQRLTPAQIVELKEEGTLDLAYQQALHYLSLRPRSESEMIAYLQGKEYAEDVVAAVMGRLKVQGDVDDDAFARFWVDNRTRFRPRGARALRYELRQKGLETATIDEALEEQDEAAAAWAAIEGRLDRWQALPRDEFDKKLMGYLARRGFDFGVCRRATEAAWRRLHGE